MDRHLREKILAEWRGLPQRLPPPDRAVPIAAVLPKLMEKLGLKERLQEEQVLQFWKDVVGDFIAEHSCPTRLKGGILYVQVVQPTVHYELDRTWKPEILKKLKQRFGTRVIRDIKFRVGG